MGPDGLRPRRAGLAEPADSDLLPLPIETDRHWGSDLWNDRIAVLGYPLGPTEHSPDFHPFTGGLGALHVSPGIRNHRPADADRAAAVDPHQPGSVRDFLAEHDASTYKGHSGSPVIALATGRVLGVHVQSGAYEGTGAVDTGNRHVMIAPAMDREDALRHAILGIGDPTDLAAWHPDVSGADTGLFESAARSTRFCSMPVAGSSRQSSPICRTSAMRISNRPFRGYRTACCPWHPNFRCCGRRPGLTASGMRSPPRST